MPAGRAGKGETQTWTIKEIPQHLRGFNPQREIFHQAIPARFAQPAYTLAN
jgi:hypothetical protein